MSIFSPKEVIGRLTGSGGAQKGDKRKRKSIDRSALVNVQPVDDPAERGLLGLPGGGLLPRPDLGGSGNSGASGSSTGVGGSTEWVSWNGISMPAAAFDYLPLVAVAVAVSIVGWLVSEYA